MYLKVRNGIFVLTETLILSNIVSESAEEGRTLVFTPHGGALETAGGRDESPGSSRGGVMIIDGDWG